VRDNETGDYWSPSWQPTHSDVEQYTCRHGMGYTTIGSKRRGIVACTRYFVPLDENLEIWQFTVSNQRQTPAALSIFSAIEFCLWDAQDDSTNFQRNYQHRGSRNRRWRYLSQDRISRAPRSFRLVRLLCRLAGYDTARDAFLGPMRGWDRPAAVERGESSNSVAHGWAPIGSHHVRMALAGGRDAADRVCAGLSGEPHRRQVRSAGFPDHQQEDGQTALSPVIAIRRTPTPRSKAAHLLGWLAGSLPGATPDIHTDRMVNVWNCLSMHGDL
jgi:cellobiose phosphorylase